MNPKFFLVHGRPSVRPSILSSSIPSAGATGGGSLSVAVYHLSASSSSNAARFSTLRRAVSPPVSAAVSRISSHDTALLRRTLSSLAGSGRLMQGGRNHRLMASSLHSHPQQQSGGSRPAVWILRPGDGHSSHGPQQRRAFHFQYRGGAGDRPTLILVAIGTVLFLIALGISWLVWSIFGFWIFAFVFVFPQTWRMLRNRLSQLPFFSKYVKPPQPPQDLMGRLHYALDPHHPMIRRHLGRMASWESMGPVEVDITSDTGGIFNRRASGTGGSGTVRIFWSSRRGPFPPEAHHEEVLQELLETEGFQITTVKINPDDSESWYDCTPQNYREDDDRGEESVIDADFVVKDDDPQHRR